MSDDSEVGKRYSGQSASTHYALENDWKSVAKFQAKVCFHCCLDDYLEQVQQLQSTCSNITILD